MSKKIIKANRFNRVLLLVCVIVFSSTFMIAQEQSTEAAMAQANNPLANMTALNIHNYYMPKFSNAPDDMYMNTSWLRFAKPFSQGKLLLRVSQPISTIGLPSASGIESTSGLGDINAFLSYNFISEANKTVGIGPLIAAPTATDDLLGSGKWQVGFASVIFIVKSPKLQLGGLITWQTSIAGDDDREDTSLGAVQPFFMWQLGKGTYLRNAAIWVLDFKNEAYSIPLGLGIGKVVKVDNTVFNLFVEPQYSMYVKGTQPQFQVFAGINLQFLN